MIDGLITRNNLIGQSSNGEMVKIGLLEFYFSYQTIIGFRDKNGSLYVSENIWGSTSGRHINSIADMTKSKRLNREDFKRFLEYKMISYGLIQP